MLGKWAISNNAGDDGAWIAFTGWDNKNDQEMKCSDTTINCFEPNVMKSNASSPQTMTLKPSLSIESIMDYINGQMLNLVIAWNPMASILKMNCDWSSRPKLQSLTIQCFCIIKIFIQCHSLSLLSHRKMNNIQKKSITSGFKWLLIIVSRSDKSSKSPSPAYSSSPCY